MNKFFFLFQIMSLHPKYISFLWQVADLGSSLSMPPLRDGARVLMKLMPPGESYFHCIFLCTAKLRSMVLIRIHICSRLFF